MEKYNKESIHWIIGLVVIVAATLVLFPMAMNYTQAFGVNGNLELNLNIPATPPEIDGTSFSLFHDNDTVTPMSLGGSIPGAINGYVNAILNINVTDLNGYDYNTINVSARLARTSDLGTTFPDAVDALDSFLNVNIAGSFEFINYYIAPDGGPIPCEATGQFFNANTSQTWRCVVQMAYYLHPTGPGTYYSVPSNYQGEDWRWLVRASDGTSTDFDYTSMYVDYDEIIGLYTDSLINFGVTEIGDPTPEYEPGATNLNIANRGNREAKIAIEVNKQTDADAWSCTGGTGEPLVSDIHYGYGPSTPYDSMWPLNLNLASSGYEIAPDQFFGRVEDTVSMKFKTYQSVAPGICTLSNIVFTAIPD